MNLEQFRKMTANLPGDTPLIIPGYDHSYRPASVRMAKAVWAGRPGGELSPYEGSDPELYGLASNVIVATRTLPVVEIA
jgi:hypothetical protein